MTRYGRKRRRLADISSREMDELRESFDARAFDLHDAEQMEREPREDPDYRAWLEPVNSDDFKAA